MNLKSLGIKPIIAYTTRSDNYMHDICQDGRSAVYEVTCRHNYRPYAVKAIMSWSLSEIKT